MKRYFKRGAAMLLVLLLAVQLLPISVLADFTASAGGSAALGDVLYTSAENGQPRHLVSETDYQLAPGIVESVVYTNEPSGLNQNIDYFCEIDLSKASIVAGYANFGSIIENKTVNWTMQKLSDQVAGAQSYMTNSNAYKDSTIVAAVNADYYNMATGQPTGVFIIDGVDYNNGARSNHFGITNDGVAVVRTAAEYQDDLKHAVGGGVILVKDGVVQPGPGGRNVTYTAIGVKADGTVVSMVCYGQSYPISCGYTAYEVAEMMKARGCVDAIMLDGSGSSTFVSRREGDSKTYTRNSPSDGQERQVSSSLFFISSAVADGVFDHAVISPKNEVYTPGSTVQFTAVGADKTGAPAPLPADLSWTVSNNFGVIDSSTGVFTSNGTVGEVTVTLSAGGQPVGTATIQVQAPDKLMFTSETVSVGFGGNSTLNFKALYQDREMHYNDGDFVWALSDSTMGSFTGNTFYASESATVTGTATVTSKWDETVTATVTVEVGKEPKLVMDFEDPTWNILHGTTNDGNSSSDIRGVFENGTYYGTLAKGGTPSAEDQEKINAAIAVADAYCVSYTGRNGATQPQVGKAEIASLADGAPVHSGSYSLKIDYNFTGNNNITDGACFGLKENMVLEGNPNKVGLWVYIPEGTPSLWLRLRYIDGLGNSSQIDFTKSENNDPNALHLKADNAWHYYEANISHLATPVTIPAGMAIRLMVLTYSGSNIGWTVADGSKIAKEECYGSLYFDDLTFVYGSTNQDVIAPEVSDVTVNDVELIDGAVFTTDTLNFRAYFQDSLETSLFNSGINTNNVLLYVDGKLVETANVDGANGEIRADGLKLCYGEHIVKLLVTDIAGNQNILTYNIVVNAPGADDAPIVLSTREDEAMLGKQVNLDFVPAAEGQTELNVTVQINKAFKDSFTLIPADGITVTSAATYDSLTSSVSFAVSGTAAVGQPVATLTFDVPTSVAPGTSFTYRVTKGIANDASFALHTRSLPITAPYIVTSDTMVRGVESTLYFTVKDKQGNVVPGAVLKQDDGTQSQVGIADENGKVSYTPVAGVAAVTVYAEFEGGVSGKYTATIYTTTGKSDGTPTHVWRNASDDASTLNVSWFSNPLYSAGDSVIQIAENQADVESADPISGTKKITGFTDGVAANVCGAVVTGLASGRTYYYRVGDGTNWSEVESFTTGYENTDVSALILGDLQEDNNTTLTGILNSLTLSNYDLAIQTGDLVDAGGNYGLWDNTLAMIEALDIDRLFATGNHEKEGGLPITDLIYNQEDDNYYSVEYGNVYFATIAHAGGSIGYEEALAWLVEDAQKSDATWKILVTHQPAYYTNVTAGIDSNTQAKIYTAVQEAGIDVVLSGHDHSYARTAPLYNGAVDEENGITYFICGSLGEKSYAVTDNPDFHFAKLSDSFGAVYSTLSTSDDTLTIKVYDYNGGVSTELDTFTKTKSLDEHTHTYTWDGVSRMVCSCGYNIPQAGYTGYANIEGGRGYFSTGNLMKGVFAVGEEVLHAGEDGVLHDTETIVTAQCWEDGHLGCLCKDCNTFYQLTERRRQGHDYDENYVCQRMVFDLSTFTFVKCGHQGKDIATLDMSLAYTYGFYTGTEKIPAVTIKDGDYTLFPQSTYGDYMPYWENNVNVGTARIRIEGYADGPYYGSAELTFQIVPNNAGALTATNITSNSATITWAVPNGATSYIVYEMIDGKLTRLGVVDEPSYTATDLSAGDHEFCIRPFATVDGVAYYSTKNSDLVKVTVEAGKVSFAQQGTVTATYGDEPFTNAASMDGSSEGFTYASSDTTVATVNTETGEVTILNAGTVVITAAKGEDGAQYRLNVQPKAVDVIWSGTYERVYDGNVSSVTAQASGLLGEDTANVTVTDGDKKDAGTHTATATAIDNPNYTLSENATVQYTITPADLKVAWPNVVLTYTGRAQAPVPVAGEGLAQGDEVTFTVPTAVEPGTYKVTALSNNPNYVVDETCVGEFSIVMPDIRVVGAAGDEVACYMDGTTIYVNGMAEGEVTVTVENVADTSASTQVSAGGTSTVTLDGVVYNVDATEMIAKLTDIKIKPVVTDGAVADGAEIEEEHQESVNDAVSDQTNALAGLGAAIASNAEQMVNDYVPELDETPETLYLHTSVEMNVKAYDGDSYTLDIQPVFQVSDQEHKEDIPEGTPVNKLPNEYITAPVTVTLKMPAGFVLNANTYIRHLMTNGRVEYIKPQYDAVKLTVTFSVRSFSEFTVYSDSRAGSISFDMSDGTVQTKDYLPENVGEALPTEDTAGFSGWTIDGVVYTTLTDALLDKIDGTTLEATPYIYVPVYIPPVLGNLITVNAAANGTVTADKNRAEADEKVVITVAPAEGYMLSELTVTDGQGNAVIVIRDGAKEYSFTMPNAAVTIKASFEARGDFPFEDVFETDWYYDAVKFAFENGLMDGVSSDRFAPTAISNRAMLVTILYRLEGKPAGAAPSGFNDVEDGIWYSDAIAWAAANKIVDGVEGNNFAPTKSLTREQMATILYRYAVYKGYDVTAAGDLTKYIDSEKVSGYAEVAMEWANGAGLIDGVSKDIIRPQGDAIRGQMATILMRFCKNIAWAE